MLDLRLDQPIGKMAVIIDEQTDQAEVIPIDALALVSMVINSSTGLAMFSLAFGGYDSMGKFHIASKFADQVAAVTIQRQEDPAAFDALFCDAAGNPCCHYPSSFFETLMPQLVKVAYRQWGGRIPDMQLSCNGKPVFKARKGLIEDHATVEVLPPA